MNKDSLLNIKEVKLLVPGQYSMVELLGHHDELLKIIESRFDSDIIVRGNEITIQGEEREAEIVATIFQELLELLETGRRLEPHSVNETIEIIREEEGISPKDIFSDTILVHRGKAISPKTKGQKEYINAIRKNVLTFVIGPAGTGKTFLAMAMAVQALKSKSIGRLILTRPVVEAGEKLGFLPGDMYQKVDPYLKPLFDALYDMMDVEQFKRLLDQGTIEVVPLAYMRGRTLNDSFIILDEAQNTSPEQMKMFLTRFGFGSKVIVTGDITQIDLPRGQVSGLVVIEKILTDIESISFIRLTAKDVVRHKLVQKIVEAYKKFDEGSDK